MEFYETYMTNQPIPGFGGGRPVAGPKKQFNIRVDAELLRRFREYCDRNGLEPRGQIVLFMKRVVESEFDFQDKLWEALRRESE